MKENLLVSQAFDVESIRDDFPILKRKMNGQRLVYLDNAATAQKPLSVIQRMEEFDQNEYATVHRGVYALSQDSTVECQEVRRRCQRFLGADREEEIIFVRGATEAINLVASAYGNALNRGDEILITAMEHHANLVPWQILAEKKGLVLKVAPISDEGELLMDDFKKLLNPKTKMVAVTHVSNVLGTINPVEEIVDMVHQAGAVILIDGAQAVPHLKVNVRELDCDFYCFSGHKFYGPTGVGVLYGKLSHLEAMTPYQAGGDMIESVTFKKTTYAKPPSKFEAGTPAITQIVGLGAAMDYLEKIGFGQIASHEHELLAYATSRLGALPYVRLIGKAPHKTSVISFLVEGVHAHDVGTVLDQKGIAIRAGHHCAQPLMHRLGVPATVRASFAFYNTKEEVDALVLGLQEVKKIFK
jgi:cysteine desulfurase / selenocysteine lyase